MVQHQKRKIKRKGGKAAKTAALIAIAAVTLIFACFAGFGFLTKAVSDDSTTIAFTVNEGDSYTDVGNNLKEQGFIRSTAMYKLYIKFISPDMLYAGDYPLSKAMSLKQIIEVIAGGETYSPEAFNLTFPEGRNIPQIARLIAENTDNTEDDFLVLLKDEEYLDTLIEEYWFLTDEIKNDDIYYSLEGYLFPDTYQLTGKDMSVKEIITMMLDRTDKILSKYKTEIENSNFTVHQMVTLASIVELEAGNAADRADVAGVFYNRLAIDMSLGSCVTSFYGSRVEMGSRDLYYAELNDPNPYNTRNSDMLGLPVGPICCPGESSIASAISPNTNDYYFFVSDVDNNTYFTKTYEEHEAMIDELQEKGIWLTYE